MTPTTASERQPQAIQIPGAYFNGFTLGLSNADITMLLLLDNEPVLKLNLSYTTAKTLLSKLGEMMETLERVTGREIMTTEDAAKGLETLQSRGEQA